LRAQLPAGSAAACAVGAAPAPLFAGEEVLVAQAGEKRRGEFAAGRAAARAALAQIGAPAGPILACDRGGPIWPPGVVGSISHTDRWAIAVASERLQALGVDLESDDALDRALAEIVCRPEERRPDADLARRGIDAAKLRFVAKEAFYKAVFPRARRFLDFEDVCICFDLAADRFDARFVGVSDGGPVPAEASGAFRRQGGLLCAVCAIAECADDRRS
jgi:4'-phosphopantetheinyl transferase EntD